MTDRVHNIDLAETLAYEEQLWRGHLVEDGASAEDRTAFAQSIGGLAAEQTAAYFKEHPNEHNLPTIEGVPVVSRQDMCSFGKEMERLRVSSWCWNALVRYKIRCREAGRPIDPRLQVRFFDAGTAARHGLQKAAHLDLATATRLARLFATNDYDYYTPQAPLARYPGMSLGAAGFLAFYINYELNLDPPIPLPQRRQKNTKPI